MQAIQGMQQCRWHAAAFLLQTYLLMTACCKSNSYNKPNVTHLLQALYPAICLKNAEMLINFGDSSFKFGPPPGYVGISKAPADITAGAVAAAAAVASNSSERLPLCLVLEPSR
jgi:hypothetical protein